MGIADQGTFHVVDAQAENSTVFYYGERFVTDSRQMSLLSAVGSVHMPVEHKTFTTTSSLPVTDDVCSTFFNILPTDF